MKYIFFLLTLTVIGFTSYTQERSTFDFNIISSQGSEVGINVSIKCSGKHHFEQNDSIIQRIESIIIDSLDKFDMFQMYAHERYTMNVIIDSIFRAELRPLQVEVQTVVLREVNIPEEAKQLYMKSLKLEQKYIEVYLEIYKREQELKSKLEAENNLSDSEKKEIEMELLVLKNYRYVSQLYDKMVKALIMNN